MDGGSNNEEYEDALSNHENVRHHHTESRDDDAVENALAKQKSVRMTHLDPQPGHKDSRHESKGEVSNHRNRDGPSGRATSLPVEL